MECECGYTYVPGHPDDEVCHSKIHNEYLSGPEIPVIRTLTPSVVESSLPIYIIDESCPKVIRRDIAHVAIVAWRSIQHFPVGYDGSITDEEPRLFLAADGDHIVAMVLTSFDDRFWPLAWKPDGSLSLLDNIASTRRNVKIARVWTAVSYRRRGLALQLIQTASRHFSAEISDFGWELPFTSSGTCLVRRLCSDIFWGCCDPSTLREVLQPV
jgi:hypothetical protein